MSAQREDDPSTVTEAPQAEATTSLDDLLPDPSHFSATPSEATRPEPRPDAPVEPRMRTARLVAVRGREADVLFRRARTPTTCEVAQEVEVALLEDVLKNGGSVLVEEGGDGDESPVVVGTIATRVPRSLELKAGTVTIEADRELLLRSGRGAIRIREDGDIEVVGTRISATSRGLFRLVGRLLRLN
jgi:hypothetical protein